MSDPYIAYREQLLGRHQNAATSALSTVGDVVMVGGLAAGIATRRLAAGVVGVGFGFATYSSQGQSATRLHRFFAIRFGPYEPSRTESLVAPHRFASGKGYFRQRVTPSTKTLRSSWVLTVAAA
jgi:hypothetical protein